MEQKIYEFILKDGEEHFTTSLVKDPAVESTLMHFNKEENKPIFFANEEKRVIYSVAMRPNKLIFRKETKNEPAYYGYFTAETIEKFQENYSKFKGQEKTNINHSESSINGVFRLENWIVKDKDIDKSKALGMNAENGDMIMAFKIENQEVWEQCKNGDLDGLSIEAILGKKEINNFKTENNMNKEKNPQTLWDLMKSFFSEQKEETEEEKKAREEKEAAEKLAEQNPATPPVNTDEDLKKENEMLKEKVASLEEKLATMEADKIEKGVNLETMKKEMETLKADFQKFKSETPIKQPIKDAPSLEDIPYEKMSNVQKLKFNKEKGIR